MQTKKIFLITFPLEEGPVLIGGGSTRFRCRIDFLNGAKHYYDREFESIEDFVGFANCSYDQVEPSEYEFK